MANASPLFPRLDPPPATAERRARIEHALREAVDRTQDASAPPRLTKGLRYAVFPGGGRVRPQLCLIAATACGDGQPRVVDGAAAAIELLHCASLVHDDLPCFDDSEMRRGKPSVHAAFGESTALLVGDALIVMAFETLSRAAAEAPRLAWPLCALLSGAAGPVRGIIAGQAWECETTVLLDDYHRAKTASLFRAAAAMGALAGGGEPDGWLALGDLLGCAYQCADDLRDATGASASLGKPTGRDAALGRPNAVRARGVGAARERLANLLDASWRVVPPSTRQDIVRSWLAQLTDEIMASVR